MENSLEMNWRVALVRHRGDIYSQLFTLWYSVPSKEDGLQFLSTGCDWVCIICNEKNHHKERLFSFGNWGGDNPQFSFGPDTAGNQIGIGKTPNKKIRNCEIEKKISIESK